MIGTVGWAWCHASVIPVRGQQRQKDLEFKANLGYTVRCCFRQDKELLQSWEDSSVSKVLLVQA